MAKRIKLPVMQTAFASWRLLIAEWRFSLLLGLPLVAFMLLALPAWQSLVALPLANAGAMQWMPGPVMFIVGLDLLMSAPIYIGFAVALVPLHRRILLDEERRLPFRLGRREVSYGAFLVLLEAAPAILVAALAIPMINAGFQIHILGQNGVIPEITGDLALPVVLVCFAMLIIYLYARLSLALPGMAIGAPAAIANGWRRTRGNGMRLVAVTILVSLPAALPLLLLIGLWSGDSVSVIEGPILLDQEALRDREWPAPFVAPSAAMALVAVLSTLVVLPDAAALSLAYKRLAGANDAAVEAEIA